MNNSLWRILLGISLAILPLVSIINNLAFAQDSLAASEEIKHSQQNIMNMFILVIVSLISVVIGTIGLFSYFKKRNKRTTIQ